MSQAAPEPDGEIESAASEAVFALHRLSDAVAATNDASLLRLLVAYLEADIASRSLLRDALSAASAG